MTQNFNKISKFTVEEMSQNHFTYKFYSLELEAFDQAKNGDRSPTPTSSYPIANAITKPKLSPGSIFKNFFK